MATQTRVPTSDLLVTGTWTPYPASPTTRYDKVDDGAGSKDDDTTYIIGITNNDLIDFGFDAFTIPAGSTVSEVRVYAYAKDASSGTNSANGRVSCGATPTGYNHGTTVDPNGTTYTLYSWAWTTNPHHAGYAWTPDDVNGVGTYGLKRFGYRCPDAAPDVRFSSAWIECTYEEPPTYVDVAGTLAAASTAVGVVKLLERIVGTLSAAAQVTGAAKVARRVAGALSAAATVVGDVTVTGIKEVAGSLAATSAVQGGVRLLQRVTATSAAQATAEAYGRVTRRVAAALGAMAVTQAAAKMARRIAGAAAATTEVTGTVTVTHTGGSGPVVTCLLGDGYA